MTVNFEKVSEEIEANFPRTISPVVEWEECATLAAFTKKYGTEFFTDFWKCMHNDLDVTRFLFPLTMRYFLAEPTSTDCSLSLDLFIGTIDPGSQEVVHRDASVDMMFHSYTHEQQRTVCHWLHAMKSRDPLLVNVDSAITFWCNDCNNEQPGT